MNCPLCLDETLQAHVRGGIEIDVCPRCRGVWLDRGELDRLVEMSAPTKSPRPAPAATEPHAEYSKPKSGKSDKKGKKKKPKSKAKMFGDLLEDILDM